VGRLQDLHWDTLLVVTNERVFVGLPPGHAKHRESPLKVMWTNSNSPSNPSITSCVADALTTLEQTIWVAGLEPEIVPAPLTLAVIGLSIVLFSLWLRPLGPWLALLIMGGTVFVGGVLVMLVYSATKAIAVTDNRVLLIKQPLWRRRPPYVRSLRIDVFKNWLQSHQR
jgi:hypothetical protein